MANDDLKTIKELLEIVKHKVDMMDISARGLSASVHLIKDRQSVMNTKLDALSRKLNEVKDNQEDHTERLEALSGDTEQLLTEVKAIHDEIGLWHSRDKREIDEIKKHLHLPIMPDIPD